MNFNTRLPHVYLEIIKFYPSNYYKFLWPSDAVHFTAVRVLLLSSKVVMFNFEEKKRKT